jgi:hypothetical protein
MIIDRIEFSVMSVASSNRRVTHLRDLDARDGLVISGNAVRRGILVTVDIGMA